MNNTNNNNIDNLRAPRTLDFPDRAADAHTHAVPPPIATDPTTAEPDIGSTQYKRCTCCMHWHVLDAFARRRNLHHDGQLDLPMDHEAVCIGCKWAIERHREARDQGLDKRLLQMLNEARHRSILERGCDSASEGLTLELMRTHWLAESQRTVERLAARRNGVDVNNHTAAHDPFYVHPVPAEVRAALGCFECANVPLPSYNIGDRTWVYRTAAYAPHLRRIIDAAASSTPITTEADVDDVDGVAADTGEAHAACASAPDVNNTPAVVPTPADEVFLCDEAGSRAAFDAHIERLHIAVERIGALVGDEHHRDPDPDQAAPPVAAAPPEVALLEATATLPGPCCAYCGRVLHFGTDSPIGYLSLQQRLRLGIAHIPTNLHRASLDRIDAADGRAPYYDAHTGQRNFQFVCVPCQAAKSPVVDLPSKIAAHEHRTARRLQEAEDANAHLIQCLVERTGALVGDEHRPDDSVAAGVNRALMRRVAALEQQLRDSQRQTLRLYLASRALLEDLPGSPTLASVRARQPPAPQPQPTEASPLALGSAHPAQPRAGPPAASDTQWTFVSVGPPAATHATSITTTPTPTPTLPKQKRWTRRRNTVTPYAPTVHHFGAPPADAVLASVDRACLEAIDLRNRVLQQWLLYQARNLKRLTRLVERLLERVAEHHGRPPVIAMVAHGMLAMLRTERVRWALPELVRRALEQDPPRTHDEMAALTRVAVPTVACTPAPPPPSLPSHPAPTDSDHVRRTSTPAPAAAIVATSANGCTGTTPGRATSEAARRTAALASSGGDGDGDGVAVIAGNKHAAPEPAGQPPSEPPARAAKRLCAAAEGQQAQPPPPTVFLDLTGDSDDARVPPPLPPSTPVVSPPARALTAGRALVFSDETRRGRQRVYRAQARAPDMIVAPRGQAGATGAIAAAAASPDAAACAGRVTLPSLQAWAPPPPAIDERVMAHLQKEHWIQQILQAHLRERDALRAYLQQQQQQQQQQQWLTPGAAAAVHPHLG